MRKIVALIPARSGSKRVTDKNIRNLNGHPLIAYTINSAIESGVFDAVICSTDSVEYAEIAKYYGAEVPALRPQNISGDGSPDIEWVDWILNLLHSEGRIFDAFSILRPTSPFRMPETIRRAWNYFLLEGDADSLRAVEKCKQHPGKMWILQGQRMLPLLPFNKDSTPWHSCQYASLPEVYVQNASLEIAWVKTVLVKRSIAGESILPFISQGLEGFDINEPDDWILAESHIKSGKAITSNISLQSFFSK